MMRSGSSCSPVLRCGSSPSVKYRRIVFLDYADLVEGPRDPSAIARLGGCLRTVAVER
ncbi:hypothetical protein [Streptomyces sp. SCL15-4]|uniref:hypothetical protein n=1 Tax=Streptomyces sp. SCL15-4 TaxID=2967221 RepID=UPI002966C1FC|nr:hypothetical protein [Streptomyces sp. SCL15-4]